jgi:truncated hemoglobin YjbI
MGGMKDEDILQRVGALVDEERELRQRLQADEISAEEEHERLRTMEEALDQCWDLLRQRRALREAGEDPDHAQTRPPSEVENYEQ